MRRGAEANARAGGRRRRLLVVAVIGAASFATPAPARAAEVRVVSRTIGEGYMVRVPGPGAQLVGRRRLSQYVNLGVYHLLPPKEADERVRDPADGQLEIVTSLRLRHDFGTFSRAASPSDGARLRHVDGRQIDLLFGYLEGRRLAAWVDLRLGRQFEMSGLDFYAFDGAWLGVHTPAHLMVEVFAGFAVDGSAVFGFPTFELDGTAETPLDRSVSPTVGAAVALDDLRYADARVAYRRTWSPAALNREIPTPLGDVVDQELIAASVALRLADGRFSPFAAARYNLGTARLDDLSGGATWAISAIHTVRLLYLRTIPSFDLDSIFNVFSIEPFEDVRAVYQVRPGPRWTIEGRFQGRLFRAEHTAELGSAPEAAVTFGGGGGIGTVYRRRRFAMRIDAHGLGGEGGHRFGVDLDTRTHVLYDRIAIDGRLYSLYYEAPEDDPGPGAYSVALQVGANVKLAHGITLDVVAEELFSPYVKQSLRGFAMLTFDWAFRVGGR